MSGKNQQNQNQQNYLPSHQKPQFPAYTSLSVHMRNSHKKYSQKEVLSLVLHIESEVQISVADLFRCLLKLSDRP